MEHIIWKKGKKMGWLQEMKIKSEREYVFNFSADF